MLNLALSYGDLNLALELVREHWHSACDAIESEVSRRLVSTPFPQYLTFPDCHSGVTIRLTP
jgi:hypothetical protein